MSTQSPKTLVVIPTYNEAENIVTLMDAIFEKTHADVLVVDDNSPDGTAALVETYRLRSPRVNLLRREKKNGLAAAYTAGFSWGLKEGYDQLIEMDADFSHSPEDLVNLIEVLQNADVAVGCRYIKGGKITGWSWLRQIISRGGNVYAKTVLSLPYEDLTGGFNAWRSETLRTILNPAVTSKGYAFQVELKNRAHRNGYKIVEVPIHFRDRQKGKSKMSSDIVWEAALRVLQMRQYSTA